MSRKVTYQIDDHLVMEVRNAVQSGTAKTQSDFVEGAIRARLEELKRREIIRNIRRSTEDPLVRGDIAEIDAEFGTAVNDGELDG